VSPTPVIPAPLVWPAPARPTGPTSAATRREEWLPPVAASAAGLVGAVNVLSAVAPADAGRSRLLSALAPELLVGATSLAMPAGLALVGVAFFLGARRERAQRLAVGLLLVLALLDVVKGLDVVEAAASLGLAALLIRGRAAFRVKHEQGALPRAVATVAILAVAGLALGVTLVSATIHWATPDPTTASVVREALGGLSMTGGPLRYSGPAEWVPGALGIIGALWGALAGSMLVRPLSASCVPCPAPEKAADIVHRYGTDTLSGFKLRHDVPQMFSRDGRAFVAYRIESGVMLLSGDPVGPAPATEGLLGDAVSFAADHGLKLASIGASEEFSMLAARVGGLRRVYIGDEAIVDTATFTLEGRGIRKVRQAATRLTKAGYTVEARTVADLLRVELEELENVSARWRDGTPERGFTMVMDRIDNPSLPDALVVVARDADGRARGFLHFVPAYGRPVLSLSFMRRDRDTPNGLTEFLVVHAIALTRARGIAELSLNFAAFGRYLRAPESRTQRVFGALARRGDARFQIDSLYRFNAKFSPRWQPRYLLFTGYTSLPRTALAALWTEGQLPRLPVAALLSGPSAPVSAVPR